MTPFAITQSGMKVREFEELREQELVWVAGGLLEDCKTTTICSNEGPNCPPPQCDTGD